MAFFFKYPKVRSEINFGTLGTCIKQTFKNASSDHLKILASLGYICHFYTITGLTKQLVLVNDLLSDMVKNDFSQIKTLESKYFLDHSPSWDAIVETFNKYELSIVQRIFFRSRPFYLIYSKNLPDEIFQIMGKSFGKYKYNVRIINNKIADSTSMWFKKIKLLLPFSVFMLAHYTYLSISEDNRPLFKKTHLLLLENINIRTLSYKEKHQILNQFIKEFLSIGSA
jgi:hypothetical protein